MDPLSIATGCVGLISAITKTSILVTVFVRDVRAARSDLDAVSRELSSLRTLLELLAHDAADTSANVFPETLKKQVAGIVTNCSGVIADIEETLEKHEGTGLKKSAQWVMSGQGDMAKLRSSLEAHKSALEIALDMVAMSLAMEIKVDTQELRNDTAEIKQTIKDDTALILAEIARLQKQLPQDQVHTSGFMLQRYLDNLTSYAETACGTFSDEVDNAVERRRSMESLSARSDLPSRTSWDSGADKRDREPLSSEPEPTLSTDATTVVATPQIEPQVRESAISIDKTDTQIVEPEPYGNHVQLLGQSGNVMKQLAKQTQESTVEDANRDSVNHRPTPPIVTREAVLPELLLPSPAGWNQADRVVQAEKVDRNPSYKASEVVEKPPLRSSEVPLTRPDALPKVRPFSGRRPSNQPSGTLIKESVTPPKVQNFSRRQTSGTGSGTPVIESDATGIADVVMPPMERELNRGHESRESSNDAPSSALKMAQRTSKSPSITESVTNRNLHPVKSIENFERGSLVEDIVAVKSNSGVAQVQFPGHKTSGKSFSRVALPEVPHVEAVKKGEHVDPWNRPSVEPEEVQDLLRCCTLDIKSRALDLPLLLLPFRPTSDVGAARRFVKNFFGQSSQSQDSLAQEVRVLEPMVVVSIVKWCWSRLPGGVVGWDVYELFKVGESDSNMARAAFSTFIPLCVDSKAQSDIVFDFFDLLYAIAAHGKTNGHAGSKLSRMAGWWAFESPKSGGRFKQAYESWQLAADATSHLFFAYLRSRLNFDLTLPRQLQDLLRSTEYLPEQFRPAYHSQVAVSVKIMVDFESFDPLYLLRRVPSSSDFPRHQIPPILLEVWRFRDPVKALSDECLRILKYIKQSWDVQTFAETSPAPESAPGYLSVVKEITLDSAFWWVWMSSFADEEPVERNFAFGRTVIFETYSPTWDGKWIVLEELLKEKSTVSKSVEQDRPGQRRLPKESSKHQPGGRPKPEKKSFWNRMKGRNS